MHTRKLINALTAIVVMSGLGFAVRAQQAGGLAADCVVLGRLGNGADVAFFPRRAMV